MLIGYARVSTSDQNPELQLDALKTAGCERIFEEKASGAKRDRPALIEAMQYTRTGDTLVIWKLDRLARSLKQLLETVESLEQQGVGLLSLTENIDTSSAGGKLVFHLFGALAEFERSLIRERTIAGLASARERGRVGGRPRALSDADVAKAKAMMQNPEITMKAISETLGVSMSTLYVYLPGGRGGLENPDSSENGNLPLNSEQ